MKVCVIGGGASGMMAAITAAEKGSEVTLIEHGERLGKKILQTGNGKCNLTSACLKKNDYNCPDDPVFSAVMKKFGVNKTLSFFESIGVFSFIGKNDGYYPRSEQAAVVNDALRRKLEHAGVKVLTDFKNYNVERLHKEFVISRGREEYRFDRLILACGSKAAPITGSDGSGYKIASEFGHTINKVLPALTFLQCQEGFFKSISGVRQKGRATAFVGQTLVDSKEGEIQFTELGISGIPIFQLSRILTVPLSQKRKVYVSIDFATDYSEQELGAYLAGFQERMPAANCDEILSGFVNKKLAVQIRKNCGFEHTKVLRDMTEEDFERLSGGLKEFTVTVIKTGGFDQAQICVGGVSLEELNQNLESKLVPGLFFAGEMLDVDGDCGGFNLQWAWSSGYVAGLGASM